MKTLRLLLLLVAASTSAFAWPTCSGHWVSVPKGTTGGTLYSTGDLLFQCQPTTPTPPSPPSTPPSTTTLGSSSSASASSVASSASTSSSSSSASQKQGQTQGQNQGQTAQGGNASSSASGGNNSNNSTSNTLVQRNTPMAYAPEAIPSAPCVKGYSGGASGPAFGATFGGGKTDQECEKRETARAFALGGSRIAYCKVLITTKDAKNAGVTLDDCLQQPTPAPVAQTVLLPAAPPLVILDEAPITVVAPKETPLATVGIPLTNVSKQQLDDAALFLKQSQGGSLILQADALTGVYRTQRIMSYLSEAGVNTSRIRVRLTKDFGKSVAVIYSMD